MSDKSILTETIERRIFLIRGHKVMLDSDLARLYGVSTRRLNEQVRRNLKRFPADFMFELTQNELKNLMSQIATSSLRWGGRRKLPLAFTQEGVSMLSGVLHSPRAIEAHIAIMRAFVRFGNMLSTHQELAKKLAELEVKLEGHDEQIKSIFDAIRELMEPPDPAEKVEDPPRRIGFRLD